MMNLQDMMKKQFILEVNNMRDIEMLRIERLIVERQDYEDAFFSLEPQNDELEYTISQYIREIENISFNPFEYEDYLIELRDEKLIKEQEKYEQNNFSFSEVDVYDFQIKAMEDELFENDYDSEYYQYEEEMFYHLQYLKSSQFEKPTCSCMDLDYMPHDDGLCDYFDCYDYPEGPDENLSGVKFY